MIGYRDYIKDIFLEFMKIVNNEEGRVDMHSKAMKITYNSVVRMLDSGGSGKLKVWEGKITGNQCQREIWNHLYISECWRGGRENQDIRIEVGVVWFWCNRKNIGADMERRYKPR